MTKRDDKYGDVPEPRMPVQDASDYVESIVGAAERAATKIRADAEAEARRFLEDYKRRIDTLVDEKAKANEALAEQAEKAREQYEKFMTSVDSAIGSSFGNGSHREDPPPQPQTQPEPEREPKPRERSRRDFFRRTPEVENPGEEKGPGSPLPSEATPEPTPEVEAAEDTTRGGFMPRKWKGASRSAPAQTSAPAGSHGSRGAGADLAAARVLVAQMAAAGAERDEITARLRREHGIDDPALLFEELDI